MEWLNNIISMVMQLFSSLGPMLSKLFGGQATQAAPPPQTTTTQPTTQAAPPPVVQLVANRTPAPAAPAPANQTPSQPLSYATKDSNTQWLNPADYQGRIKIPDSIKQEAGDKGVYAMITIKAGQHADGHPYAMGFHVFEKDGKQTLIPFISGGSKKIQVSDFANSDAVESTTNAPLPGLVTDASGKTGDGIHAKRRITQYYDTPATEMIDGKPVEFKFFVELEDGKANRSAIGVHNDILYAGEDPSKPLGSQGCPVVRQEDVAVFQQEMKRVGIGTGSPYYILDPDETLIARQGVTVTAQQAPLPTPPRANAGTSRTNGI